MSKENDTTGAKDQRGYDPVKRAEEVARVVCRDDLRKYYRFRPARFYGGIATADCVGCCLRCLFCWSWNQVIKPDRFGHFYSPEVVAGRLLSILWRKHFRQVRISGNEPTIGWEHLLKVLEFLPPDVRFILETNGILIGHDRGYAEDLSRFENIYVRVSLKGCDEDEFFHLTGAAPEGFELQLRALENLACAGVRVHPAAMVSFSPWEAIRVLKRKLKGIAPGFEDFEVEELVLYGDVENRLRKVKLGFGRAYTPRDVPPEQI